MNRTTVTIINPSAPFGSNPSKEVFVPRMPMINKVTGNLAATHRKQHIATQLEAVQQAFNITLGILQYEQKIEAQRQANRAKNAYYKALRTTKNI